MSPALPRSADVNAVPESVLPAAVAEALPADTPEAPWRVRLEAVVWWHRAEPAATAVVPDALSDARTLPLTVGAVVRYLDSPVGPYSEVLGVPRVVVAGGPPAATVPFIAVDSLASLAGGRREWGLPKVLASFSWLGLNSVQASGDSWSVGIGASPRGPSLPMAAAFPVVQPFLAAHPGGDASAGLPRLTVRRSLVRGAGRARAARVTVSTTGTSLPLWLASGRHPGLVLTSAHGVVGAPRG